MQIACGCCLNHVEIVTIKGIDKTDGTTIWEYGPGSFWRHHYGVDAISGVVPNLAATLNKYAIAAKAYPTFAACGNRNTATLEPNAAEALTVTKLNSLDGTVIESATLTGFFCDVIGTSFVGLMTGLSITNAAALSGGDYVIVGERLPFIEFVDYNSNTANKEYILHAHGQQSGNVYLKTRTSNETITIPQNSTASEVETLFEATSDCVAATATGGPWPLLPISIDVEWGVSGGDIASIAATDAYSATGLGLDWEWGIVYIAEGIEALDVTINTLVAGVTFSFEFLIGNTFSYSSTGTDVSSFLTAMASAMATFATGEGADGAWESVASGLPDSISITGNTIRIIYSSAIGIDPLSVTAEGGEGSTDSRRAGSCAAAYDTGTGAMTSAVGYNFGYSSDRPTLTMFEETGDNPAVTGLNVLGILAIGSGPSNTVVVTPQLRGIGDAIKANVVEKWDIAGGLWEFSWQTYCNAEMAMPPIIPCESGYVICPINAKRFDSVRDRTAARIAVADTTTVELNTIYGSLTTGNNNVSTAMQDDTAASYFSWGYAFTYQDTGLVNNRFPHDPFGSDTWINGTELRIGGWAFGYDGSSIFGTSYGAINGGWRYDGFGESTSDTLYIQYFAVPGHRSTEPQQFRFKVTKMSGVNYTAWLDWYATESEIETALNNLLGTGNCAVVALGGAFGAPLNVDNSPASIIEHNPTIGFDVDTNFTPGSGRIPYSYFTFRNDGVFTGTNDIVIETQTTTAAADPSGISAYSATDATVTWSRAWGTKGATTISQPLYAWLQGDFVYAYGNVVDSEL